MKRLALIGLLLVSAATAALLGAGAGDGDAYRVRAIFDNAFSLVAGEDVKIAGVRVGSIESLDVTEDQKAAVVLRIDRPGFQDFRQDARCTIRPQSLIGEKFVECTPTAPRPAGTPPAPPLAKIPDGQPGAGQRLLPVTNTSRPVDIDLVNNILRRPYRERLALIINEFGTALAGRGEELRAAIRRANPALEQTDRVLAILADQNRVLADLARDSDAVMRPLARDRAQVADFVEQANVTARATAERRVDLEANIQRLPAFLRELRPTMTRLGALADEMTPVLADLGDVAPDVNTLVRDLGPFSSAATPALKTLGDAADVGSDALVAAKPITRDLKSFASGARPLAKDLAELTTSFKDTGGVERLLDYAFFQVTAINGFDSFGHYLRAGLIVNLCSTYAVEPTVGCSANFIKEERRSARAASGARSPILARTDAVLRGADPADVLAAGDDGTLARRGRARAERPQRIGFPPAVLPGGQGSSGRRGGSGEAQAGQPSPSESLFDYLFGGEA